MMLKEIVTRIFKEIKYFFKYIINHKIIILGFFIYLLFNVSALTNHFMDFFFFGSSIHHCCQGLDFYQIPNAFYAFINGGTLNGTLPEGIASYSSPYITNYNVYHPLITVILGAFFINFAPDVSINIWIYIKILITILTTFYIYKNFKENKFLAFALFIFLINFSQYNDIKISQYQFIFNISLVFLLINFAKNKDQFNGGALYFISLIAKPVGLLFAPVLIIKKKWYVLITGLSLFLVSTLTFKLIGVGDYYIDNIIYHLLTPIPTKGIDFLSLDALLRNGFGISENTVKIIKMISLFGIYLLSFNKKVHINKLLFLLVIYFLLFYDLVFQYHFSVLGPVLAVCVLTLKEFQSNLSRFLILIISLPTTYFIFRILNIGIVDHTNYGIDPTLNTWMLVSLFQLLPIIILTAIVIFPDLKNYIKSKTKNA